jgi:aminopeptidase N
MRPGPDPSAHIEQLADSDAQAFAFFLQRFGPPPTTQVIVSPIPAGFGQGFPGLVYAATLSYLAPSDPPLDKMSPADRQFYTELLRPHEIAHQWWGNNITVESGADLWMMEALATYSSLLFLEDTSGPAELQSTLAGFREHLLGKTQSGVTVESAGPVSMGERLMMAKFPTAYRLILYEKGAWIFHMLRGALGDETFFGLLTDLSKSFRLQELSSEQLRLAAAERLPPGYPDPNLRDFFEQWVEGTGIPRLRVSFKHEDGALTGELIQSEVPEYFTAPVKLRAVFESAKPIDFEVWTEGERTPFRIPSPHKPLRIQIDPDETLLAVKEN